MNIPTKIQYKDFAANLVTGEFLQHPIPNALFKDASTGRMIMNPVMGVSTWLTFVHNVIKDENSDAIILKEGEI